MKIALYGSAAGDGLTRKNEESARIIGKEIARMGHELITGACMGLPQIAGLAAIESGGIVTGFSPGINLEDHIERFKFPTTGFTKLVHVPKDFPFLNQVGACLKLRNVYSAAYCDGGIAIAGRWGTANEVSNLHDMGKSIGVLEGSRGFTKYIWQMVHDFNKISGSKVVYSSDPIRLVGLLEEAIREQQ